MAPWLEQELIFWPFKTGDAPTAARTAVIASVNFIANCIL
jgi:hypothetical protein